jgi:aromatic-amino-acid transaminase
MTDSLVLDPPLASKHLLGRLDQQPADSLLALIGLHRSDQRTDKIDLGVGVYKDEAGRTPVMGAVKTAEAMLLAGQGSKSYLGPEGDIGFFDRLTPIIFGDLDLSGRLSGLQTPGGTGALRLAGELIYRANPHARVLVGMPTWPNHVPLLEASGLQIVPHTFFDVTSQNICFDNVLEALNAASAGDVVLLHACCHNPTGADFSLEQWIALTEIIVARRLLPLVDMAYQGLGDGLDEDAAGLRLIAAAVPELLLAYSCDKNFGLYRERVGGLFAISATSTGAAITQSTLLALARANWSMPPDHGAAVVRIVLDSPDLSAQWRAELNEMRTRIADVRKVLSSLDPSLASMVKQKGMFSTLALSGKQITDLRVDHAVYMAGSGRINLAGFVPTNIASFIGALALVR